MESLRECINQTIYTLNIEQPSLLDIEGKLVTLPSSSNIIIVGDLHGDHKSLDEILGRTKWREKKSDDKPFLIFLGDYIDRGPEQLHVLKTVSDLVNLDPDKVILLRGNHEAPRDISPKHRDFTHQLQNRYGKDWIKADTLFQSLFDAMFTAVYLPENLLILHAGIPSEAKRLSDIASAHLTHPETKILEEILWNDVSIHPGYNESFRGKGKTFGQDVAANFLDSIDVKTLVRGHESHSTGFSWQGNRILTIFSCKIPQYGNEKIGYARYQSDNNSKNRLMTIQL